MTRETFDALFSACKTLVLAWDAGDESNDVDWEDLCDAVRLAEAALAKAEQDAAPDFYQLPESFDWERVARERIKWGIDPRMFPGAVVPGQCVGWGVPLRPSGGSETTS